MDVNKAAKAHKVGPLLGEAMATNLARGIDHVGLTVPDIEAAHQFLVDGLGAEVLYEVVGPGDRPLQGPEMEQAVAVPPGARISCIRMYKMGNGPGIELFKYETGGQREPLRACDYGWQHIALYVDDMDATAKRAVGAGAVQLSPPLGLMGPEAGGGANFCFLRAPFGALIELITFPNPQAYESAIPLRRWKPPPQT